MLSNLETAGPVHPALLALLSVYVLNLFRLPASFALIQMNGFYITWYCYLFHEYTQDRSGCLIQVNVDI